MSYPGARSPARSKVFGTSLVRLEFDGGTSTVEQTKGAALHADISVVILHVALHATNEVDRHDP